LYLRDLPESVYTSAVYNKMFEAYTTIPSHDQESRKAAFLNLFSQIPQNPNQVPILLHLQLQHCTYIRSTSLVRQNAYIKFTEDNA
jgi:hypothetical protein